MGSLLGTRFLLRIVERETQDVIAVIDRVTLTIGPCGLVPTGTWWRVRCVCCRLLLTSVVASHFCLFGARITVAAGRCVVWPMSVASGPCVRTQRCKFFSHVLRNVLMYASASRFPVICVSTNKNCNLGIVLLHKTKGIAIVAVQ